MGGTGQVENGLIAIGQTDGGFLSGIPWWAYAIVILIGLGLSSFCFIQYRAARRRAVIMPLPGAPPPLPGAPPPLAGSPPPGAGSGFLIGGIASAVLLVLAPLVVMLIMQPWGDNWIVGRWSTRPGCVGETVEFTSAGTLIADGRSRPYRVDGDQVTVDGRTQTVRHDGDRIIAGNETFYRCSGSEAATAPPAPPPAPSPSPYGSSSAPPPPSMSTATPPPAYASWLIGRWSDSNCRRSMEFRADGTATTANGQPATYLVTPNGQGVHITIESGGQQVRGWMDQTPSGAILRAYRPAQREFNLVRC